MKKKVRLIASYLPQFHPTKENNEWWGPGFTEWTNVGKAKALFKDHYQPRVPADLGYYDLRLEEVRIQQAEMAINAGIESFCYWHYWFGNGKTILDLPFKAILNSGKPGIGFCLGWANESWSGIWHGAGNEILLEQTYPGIEDYEAHFNYVLRAFRDIRYTLVDGKPVFMVYKPFNIPDTDLFISLWRELAHKHGLKGIYLIAQTTYEHEYQKLLDLGYDAVNLVRLYDYERKEISLVKRGFKRIFNGLRVYNYSEAMNYFIDDLEIQTNCIPTIIPNWDHSPRSGVRGYILHDSTPELFDKHIKQVYKIIENKPEDLRISFVKSWNEWGEGNYLEPDLVHGNKYLEVLRRNTLL